MNLLRTWTGQTIVWTSHASSIHDVHPRAVCLYTENAETTWEYGQHTTFQRLQYQRLHSKTICGTFDRFVSEWRDLCSLAMMDQGTGNVIGSSDWDSSMPLLSHVSSGTRLYRLLECRGSSGWHDNLATKSKPATCNNDFLLKRSCQPELPRLARHSNSRYRLSCLFSTFSSVNLTLFCPL